MKEKCLQLKESKVREVGSRQRLSFKSKTKAEAGQSLVVLFILR